MERCGLFLCFFDPYYIVLNINATNLRISVIYSRRRGEIKKNPKNRRIDNIMRPPIDNDFDSRTACYQS